MAGWFLRVLAITWCFWLASALLTSEGTAAARVLARGAFYAGGVTPLLMALFAVRRELDPLTRRRFWRRLFDVRRLRATDWAHALLPAPLVVAGAILIAGVVEGFAGAALVPPASWLLTPVFLLLFGPLPEEIAWRGWALDRLQRDRSALSASVLLAVVWALWHLPLFFIDGTYQHSLGVGTPRFWLFFFALLPQSLALTWVFNSSGGSVVTPIALHWMINLVGELVETTLSTEILAGLLWGGFAAALVLRYGPQRLCVDPLRSR